MRQTLSNSPPSWARDLSIHFFTIVLNGEPFIRYHEQMLAALNVDWHWHVIEGVAMLKHDTGWSLASGGNIPPAFHREGLSVDGTSAYLDEVARRFPGRVSIYRKAPQFWDGKVEMVNAPLKNIKEECLLWQIDSDEIWTAEQIEAVHRLFCDNPEKTAAYYWCRFFVGPYKVVTSRNCYSQNPKQDWLRTWRFKPGDIWQKHEPPVLARGRYFRRKRKDVAKLNPFLHDEMESIGAVFQHYAYVTESQMIFKENYYGLKNAAKEWRKLQQHGRKGKMRDFLSWVSDDTSFDDAHAAGVKPIANFVDGEGWVFSAPAPAKQENGPHNKK